MGNFDSEFSQKQIYVAEQIATAPEVIILVPVISILLPN